ncbi:type II toxin-antitoxin system PemK/MazF family toxin [Mycolicibacter longobardus]|uniref:Growth inhibitor PemK n=1 Tax=Mycolicibacter longobardus TaxID=1108812 RepID=A0A1X1YI46_9MYCO|nr:type II toxin-antitoxin system PemK/MazF family toxin [Mycolicibacter longobardus]MCV7385865.1 type II toxin-antitoxin system PemK/MazF family toxin [Mycolicibacter longobardus]ORW10724.1 hypothetical protein AWC16_13375 [Mycolicibacter longobardus]
MSRHRAGSVVVVDWRGGALPHEPGGSASLDGGEAKLGAPHELGNLRPAIVVEDHELFPNDYPNMLVVPLTRDEGLAHRSFAERIEPTAENGAQTTCWALAHHVTSVSLRRINPTDSRITAAQLASIRSRIMVAIGAT